MARGGTGPPIGKERAARLATVYLVVCPMVAAWTQAGRRSHDVTRNRHLMSLRKRIVLPVLLVLVAIVCVRLGIWQVHRLAQRRAANHIALAAEALPPVALDTVTAGAGSLAHRRVTATGRYDRAHELVIRGVSHDDQPGVYVITPLRLPAAPAVLVNRGFVPAPDAVSADLDGLDEPGVVTVSGIALPIDRPADAGHPLSRAGHTTWARLDRAAVGRLPYPVFTRFYLLQQADAATPRFPRRLEPPRYDDGPHLSYAIQWFAFAATALIVAGILLRSPVPASDRRVPRSSG